MVNGNGAAAKAAGSGVLRKAQGAPGTAGGEGRRSTCSPDGRTSSRCARGAPVAAAGAAVVAADGNAHLKTFRTVTRRRRCRSCTVQCVRSRDTHAGAYAGVCSRRRRVKNFLERACHDRRPTEFDRTAENASRPEV